MINAMKVLKRLLFALLFVPACAINAAYDITLFALKGKDIEFKMVGWLVKKLLN